MGKRVIGLGVIYASLIWLYTECTNLRCKLTLKNAECEQYRTIISAYMDQNGKGKIKYTHFKKKDEE